jgi:hypothetical protein
MNKMTLNSAIMAFAFSGILAPRRQGYEAPRVVSSDPDAVGLRAVPDARTGADRKHAGKA